MFVYWKGRSSKTKPDSLSKSKLYTETVNKVAMSSSDDKRIILENNIDTLAPGHWRASDCG